jgi:Rps23 Pro-64 3,4-dihydroxylase Tpa1-like proline 4-hydroxylase
MQRWITVNRLTDGKSLFGTVKVSEKVDGIALQNIFPFSNILDDFFLRIKKCTPSIGNVIGKKKIDWNYFTARSYIYPKNTGLSWHNDSSGYSAAYVYYIHPFWNSQWGGELLVGDNSTYKIQYKRSNSKGMRNKILGFHLNNDLESEQLMLNGFGHYFQPKPNRIIFLKAGIHHTIKKVDEAAGSNLRCSIAGFFVKG